MPGWESPVSSSQSTEGLLLSPDPHQSIISVDLQGIHGQKEVHELRQKNFWKSVFFFFNLLLLLLLLLLYSRFSLFIYFIHISVYMSIPISQFIPPRPPPLPLSPCGVHMFVLYICVSISALQTGSSVPFF